MKTQLSDSYWQHRYQSKDTPWDIGVPSKPLVSFFDRFLDKSSQNKTANILIPGGGRSYEASYLHEQGCPNVFVVDVAQEPLDEFASKNPSFPKEHLIKQDFFKLHHLEGEWDLIVEQTFFCALHPSQRESYAQKMQELLRKEGQLMGVLFDFPLQEEQESPPFGGSQTEYHRLFEPYFLIKTLKRCYNSIKPREGNEVFIQLIK